ncbi:MAG: TusE/DsrC/DsvC family sulfur relay protein [Bacteroidales bacterium]|nr:TusE/DsrC/DsvC family sulfur relay protein [Bacteroidales bacterium]
MTIKTIAGVNVDVNDEGYMNDASQWNKEVAAGIAAEENVELTDQHFELFEWMREKVANGETLTLRGIGKSGVVDAKQFYKMFPGAPLKKATKIAGVPKPTSCI